MYDIVCAVVHALLKPFIMPLVVHVQLLMIMLMPLLMLTYVPLLIKIFTIFHMNMIFVISCASTSCCSWYYLCVRSKKCTSSGTWKPNCTCLCGRSCTCTCSCKRSVSDHVFDRGITHAVVHENYSSLLIQLLITLLVSLDTQLFNHAVALTILRVRAITHIIVLEHVITHAITHVTVHAHDIAHTFLHAHAPAIMHAFDPAIKHAFAPVRAHAFLGRMSHRIQPCEVVEGRNKCNTPTVPNFAEYVETGESMELINVWNYTEKIKNLCKCVWRGKQQQMYWFYEKMWKKCWLFIGKLKYGSIC